MKRKSEREKDLIEKEKEIEREGERKRERIC